MNRRAVIALAVLGGVVVAGMTTIPIVNHARETANRNVRLQNLRFIAANLQLYADACTGGHFRSWTELDQVGAEQAGLLKPLDLGDGISISYKIEPPTALSSGSDLSKIVVIREVVQENKSPSAVLYADGHPAFEE